MSDNQRNTEPFAQLQCWFITRALWDIIRGKKLKLARVCLSSQS